MDNKSPTLEGGGILKGIFFDSPIHGLEYQTQTISGLTNEKGEFEVEKFGWMTHSILHA